MNLPYCFLNIFWKTFKGLFYKKQLYEGEGTLSARHVGTNICKVRNVASQYLMTKSPEKICTDCFHNWSDLLMYNRRNAHVNRTCWFGERGRAQNTMVGLKILSTTAFTWFQVNLCWRKTYRKSKQASSNKNHYYDEPEIGTNFAWFKPKKCKDFGTRFPTVSDTLMTLMQVIKFFMEE